MLCRIEQFAVQSSSTGHARIHAVLGDVGGGASPTRHANVISFSRRLQTEGQICYFSEDLHRVCIFKFPRPPVDSGRKNKDLKIAIIWDR